jgi:hypothetical protein
LPFEAAKKTGRRAWYCQLDKINAQQPQFGGDGFFVAVALGAAAIAGQFIGTGEHLVKVHDGGFAQSQPAAGIIDVAAVRFSVRSRCGLNAAMPRGSSEGRLKLCRSPAVLYNGKFCKGAIEVFHVGAGDNDSVTRIGVVHLVSVRRRRCAYQGFEHFVDGGDHSGGSGVAVLKI